MPGRASLFASIAKGLTQSALFGGLAIIASRRL